MIRHIDDLGRIVIPKEIRYELDIDIYDGLNIYSENEKIIITKSEFHKCNQCLTAISKKDIYCRYCGTKIDKKAK